MRLSSDKVKILARRRGESISALLARAGVSRTAFYSLARRRSVLPGTVAALASALDVSELDLLESKPEPDADPQRRVREARAIVRGRPGATFENVWHALCLLALDPLERLNRSLIRGRATALHE